MAMNTPKRIGVRIASLRKEKGWTQADLAKHTQGVISKSQLSNYEAGLRTPGIDELIVLGKTLGVTAGFIAGFTRFRYPLDDSEIEFITHFRVLPERERKDYIRRISALSMAYRQAVPDENLGHFKSTQETKAKVEP